MSAEPAASPTPRTGVMQAVLLGLIRCYRLYFSAWIGAGCRFQPTCSAYAQQAVQRHGAAAGSYLAARRVLRCHPGCRGGIDEVPAQAPHFFS